MTNKKKSKPVSCMLVTKIIMRSQHKNEEKNQSVPPNTQSNRHFENINTSLEDETWAAEISGNLPKQHRLSVQFTHARTSV